MRRRKKEVKGRGRRLGRGKGLVKGEQASPKPYKRWMRVGREGGRG